MFSAENAFDRARSRAFWRQVAARLLGRDNHLLPFDEVRRALRAHSQHERGLQQVPIDRIVGSVGRYRDFDRAFLPAQSQTRERWVSIIRARYSGLDLPPVDLFQVGELYFVEDGNHRISVARERGQAYIDAYVTVVEAPVPVTSAAELEALLERQDAIDFFARTRLLALRPHARVELSQPGRFDTLLDHIRVHRWLLGVERQSPVSCEQAVVDWYDQLYAPLVGLIRSHEILREFPGRTESDLYLWIQEHRWHLAQAGCLPRELPLDDFVDSYARQFGRRPLTRLGRLVRRLTG